VGQFDVILIFGVAPLMHRLGDKLEREARSDAVVCCRRFALPQVRSVNALLALSPPRDRTVCRPPPLPLM
jgi:hypothetical protein